MEEKIIENIKEKLVVMGDSYDSLNDNMKEYLYNIESSIQKKDTDVNKSVDTIKESVYSVSSLSTEIGPGRTTYYKHNKLLQRYVEFSLENSKKINPYFKILKLEEEVSKRNQKIELLKGKDLELILEKKKNLEYENEINKLLEENNELRNKLLESTKKAKSKKKVSSLY